MLRSSVAKEKNCSRIAYENYYSFACNFVKVVYVTPDFKISGAHVKIVF